MDVKVALSIYNKPWLIEPQTGLLLLDHWEQVKSGEVKSFNYRQARTESAPTSIQKFFSNDIVQCPSSDYEMSGFDGFDGATIAVIPVTGPLMKYDYCGDFGTETITSLIKMADATPSVKVIVLLIDSPGGVTDGTDTLANTIKNCVKQTIAVGNGLVCSAAYWIASACKTIYVVSPMNIIGSIGTMISWYNTDGYDKQNGMVLREYYATASKDKNKMFRDANAGNGKLLIEELLNPVNNVFLNAVKENRGDKLNAEVLTGKTYLGEEAITVGLIDGIDTLDNILSQAIANNLKTKTKNVGMTTENKQAFARVAQSAKTDGFAVVEGGFLATEESLNNINAELVQNDTTIRTQAGALAALQAREAEFATAEANKTELTTTKAALTTAEGKVTDLQAKLDAANATIAAHDKEPGSFASAPPKTTNSGQDGPAPYVDPLGLTAEERAALDKTESEQTAKRHLG